MRYRSFEFEEAELLSRGEAEAFFREAKPRLSTVVRKLLFHEAKPRLSTVIYYLTTPFSGVQVTPRVASYCKLNLY